MPKLPDRLPELLEERAEFLPMLRSNAENPERDANGSASSSLANSLRFMGVAEYVLRGDVACFRAKLAESARMSLRLFQRHGAGEPVSGSLVTMLAYKELLDALAAGDFPLARDLAEEMGGRDALEQEHDHPFDYALGYALKAAVLADGDQLQASIDAFEQQCAAPENANFVPYATLLSAIASADTIAANAALADLVKAHAKESKGQGVFKDSEDEVLCVWGIGLTNLARHRGMPVEPVPPLIPGDLLVDSTT